MSTHQPFSLQSVFTHADLSLEKFSEGCKLIIDKGEYLNSSAALTIQMPELSDDDFLTILSILDHYKLVELQGRDFVILSTFAEFQIGVSQILEDLLLLGDTHHKFLWKVEEKMVIITESGVRFSVSIFFRWCEVLIHLLSHKLFVTKDELLGMFSLMTESRNNYCVQIMQQQQLLLDTPVGLFPTSIIFEIEEWLYNMKEDLKAGFDLGS